MNALQIVIVLFGLAIRQNPLGQKEDPKTGLTESVKKAMLDLHNKLRKEEKGSNMNELVWDNDLAVQSKQWAKQCNFIHDFSADAKASKMWPQGQNLYAKEGDTNMHGAVKVWWNEKRDFDYNGAGGGTCRPNEQCGHYTAVVWGGTERVGCAYHRCPTLKRSKGNFNNAAYIVCQYFPGGNIGGMKPYRKGEACSACANNRAFCKNGLCQPGCTATSGECKCLDKTPCPYCNKRDPNTCKCVCGDGFLGDNCEDMCGDRNPKCKKYSRFPAKMKTKICGHPVVKKQCLKWCGMCKPLEKKSWSCGADNYASVFAKFDAGTEKVGSCFYPYKYGGKWHGKGSCFEESGTKYCSKTHDYDTYRQKAPCP